MNHWTIAKSGDWNTLFPLHSQDYLVHKSKSINLENVIREVSNLLIGYRFSYLLVRFKYFVLIHKTLGKPFMTLKY